MPRRRQPTVRQARLGTELQKLREAAGLKGREAAALLGTDAGRLSQIESGVAGVSEDTVRRLASHYACTDDQLIDALVAIATDKTRGWWEAFRRVLPDPFLDLSELEHHATYRWDVSYLFIPGLLQTEDYARVVFSYRVPALSAEDLELRVRHRMQRRAVLEGPHAAPYEAVVHEAALRIRAGTRSAARAQLLRILDVSEADNATIRVIPFDLDGFGGVMSTMAYLGGAVDKLDTVIRDAPYGTGHVHNADELNTYRTLFRRVKAMSLDPEKSRDLINRLAKEL
ncbi:helix-turn-helix transcriptional regulator [Streptomyces sp. NPDC006622]|uniref:helix-turn-helix domain-containing protein n=1 Tax=Streptomyces sp. NPDC006622 TaxID=3155459 RepID=UPI0033A3A14F